MNRFPVLFFLLVAIAIFLPACSGQSSPTNPTSSLTGQDNNFGIGSGRVLWGMYHVTLDPETLSADIVPLRTAEVGVNVTRFLAPPIAPVNLIQFTFDTGDSNFEQGLFVLDVTLKHPFPGLPKYRGFDVRGIFMSDADSSLPGDGTLTYAGDSASHMLNPDGYTRWWNSTEFTSTGIFGFNPGKLAPPTHPSAILNPYKYFSDDLQNESPLTDLTLANRGTFGTNPGINTRRYAIQFKMNSGKPAFDFNYAIDASWEDLGPGATSYNVSDFPLSANCNEAWYISVSSSASDLYYVDGTNKGGNLVLDVGVHDWQATAPSGTVAGQIAGINLHSTLFNTGKTEMLAAGATLLSEDTGVATWRLTLPSSDLDLTASGDFDIWAEVLSNSPNTYAPQIPNGDLIPHADGPLAAYVKDKITVANWFAQDAPTVTEVIPPNGYQDKILTDVQILGANFIADGLAVRFDNGTFQIPVSNLAFVSATEITCDLDLTGAEIDKYDVTVTVNFLTGPGTLEGTLPEGFEVLPPKYGWPFVGRNAQRNCLSSVKGPESLNQVYARTCTGAYDPEALMIGVDPDNASDWLVYIGYFSFSTTTKFSAYRASDGSEKWSVDPEAPYNFYQVMAVAPPGVPCPDNENGAVYVWGYIENSTQIPEKILALSAKNGAILWEYADPGYGSWLRLDRYAMIDSNGDLIYTHYDWQVGKFYLRCLDHVDGSVKWVLETPGQQTPNLVMSHDGSVGYLNFTSSITAYNMTVTPPTVKWNLNLDAYLPGQQQSDPIVASDGSLYIMSRTSNLVKVADNGSSGSVVWSTPAYSPSEGALIQLAEGPDGSIYSLVPEFFGASSPCYLYRFNPVDGAVMNQTPAMSVEMQIGMAIGSDGLIYLAGNGFIWCFNPDLTEKSSLTLPMSQHTDCALLDDGSLFVADTESRLLRKFHD